MNIYVGNLPFRAQESELRTLFEVYGEVSSCRIITDRETGRSRGYAFVEMSDDAGAQQAITKLNDTDFSGRKLQVNEARPREDRGPRRDNNRR